MKNNPASTMMIRTRKFVGDNTDALVVILLSVIVFLVCAYRIPYRVGLFLTHDEFAQYGIASFFLGYDWSPTVSRIHYYSFGYPLLLIPILLIADNAEQLYRFSLILNAALASSLVPLSYFLCKRWGFGGFKTNFAIAFIILATTLTGEVIAYSSLGLGEVLLVVLTFASVLCFYKLQDENPKGIWFAVFAFLLIYMYTVHMRTMGVLIAAGMVIILMTVLKKIKIKHLAVFLVTFTVLFIIRSFVEDIIKSYLWLDGADGNTLEARVGQFTATMTNFDRLFRAVRMMGGQLFYMGIATFALIFFAIQLLTKKSVRFFIRLKKEGLKDFDYTLIFLLLAFLGTLAISSIATSPRRADMIMYGRYNSTIFPVLSLYILVHILKGEYKFSKISAVILGSFAALTVWIAYYYSRLQVNLHMDFNVINLSWLRTIPYLTEPRGDFGVSFLRMRAFYAAFIIASFIGIIIVTVPAIKKIMIQYKNMPSKVINVRDKAVISVISVVLVLFSFVNASAFYNSDIGYFDNRNLHLRALVSNVSSDYPVYIRASGHNQSFIQFELFDRTLNPIGGAEYLATGNFYVFTEYRFAINDIIGDDRNYRFIISDAGLKLYKVYGN